MRDWFNTEYYHILYDNRDENEAKFFIDNIMNYLKSSQDSKILDIPCGKGRHSIYLSELGYNVTGMDLSDNSISEAQKHESSVGFSVHDMLDELQGKYDLILNLFTSFGYKKEEKPNIQILKNLKNALHDHGTIVMDYLNVVIAKKKLIPSERIVKKDLIFDIKRSVEDGQIKKEIKVTDRGETTTFLETVNYYNSNNFKKLFDSSGLRIVECFGNYSLGGFDENTSERIIFMLKKSN